MSAPGPVVRSVGGRVGTVAEDAWVAPGAMLLGAVTLRSLSSVWYTSVLRSDDEPIEIGERSNVQDGCVAHTAPGCPVVLGRGVSVGHRAVLHGCRVEDDVLVGMSATLLNGCTIGTGSIIAAGSVVLENTVIPPRSLVAGVPAEVRRATTDAELERIHHNAAVYVELTAAHRRAWTTGNDEQRTRS